eukprot:g4512.t1
MDYNKGQAVQAYPVATEAQQPYAPQQQPYAPQPYQQPYGQAGGTTIAQPYNGPVAQQAVVGQAGNQYGGGGGHVVVVRQGHGAAGPGAIKPSNNCLLAWFSCLCCCPIIGIFAICMASQVDKKWQLGDFDGAYRASETAKKAAITGIILGIIWEILTALFASDTIENGASDGTDGSFNNDNN